MKQYEATFQNGDIYSYTLENSYIKLKALNFGATISELLVADKDGKFENVVASFQNVEDYEKQAGPYLNAVVGPVAGRIAYGKFMMDDVAYQLSINNGCHHLHGGSTGISKQLFTVTEEKDALHFHLTCEHEKDGFCKGEFTYEITYRLDENQLIVEYLGIPPMKSLMNMTSHMYFNLSGELKDSILNHDLQLDSKEKLMIHEDGHPYKKANILQDSAFDFNQLTNIKSRYDINDAEFTYTRAYDTPFLLGEKGILLIHEKSGRKMHITTDAPSVVMYSANYFDEALILNKGRKGCAFIALALETEDIPNGVNIKDVDAHPFADKDHPYRQKTVYTFTNHE